MQAPEPILKVEWSDEDCCFVGSVPGIVGKCCHGYNTVDVYDQLVEIILAFDPENMRKLQDLIEERRPNWRH